MSEKVVIIGAGSAMFIREAIADLISRGWDAEVVLVDVSAEALQTSERLARKMVTYHGAPVRIRATRDRKRALPDATAVICTIGVGGRKAWREDVLIARKYGVFMPVGDTAGPAGTSRCLRMLPVMAAIAEDVARLAPKAVLFNHGNPMAPICRAIDKATGIKAVGLCHAVNDTAHYLRDALGVPAERFSATASGINHLTWFNDVRLDGEDAMPRLREIAAARANGSHDPLSWQMLLNFGAYPAAGDRHISEFFPALLREGAFSGKTLGVDVFNLDETINWGDGIYARLKETAAARAPLSPEFFNDLAREESFAVLDAMRSNTPRVFSATQPNVGQMPDMPRGAPVETPVLVDGGGIKPVIAPPLPSAINAVLASRFSWVELVVDAALQRSRDKLVQALLVDGAVTSFDTANRLADEYLKHNQPYVS